MRTVDVPWFTPEPGRKLSFQVRAWDNRGGTATSWSTALGSDTPIGWSDVITPSCPDPLPGQPQQIYLTGLTSFNTWLASAASQAFSVTSFTTNVVAMPGTTATLAAEVYRCRVSSGIVNQQWWRADRPIPGATNSMLVLTNVSSIDAGDYVFVIGPTFFGQSRYTMRLLVPPRFTAIQFSPPRTATLTYDTGRELNVTVQAATSLSNWVNLHTGPATGQFQDNNATNQTRRYRLRLEP